MVFIGLEALVFMTTCVCLREDRAEVTVLELSNLHCVYLADREGSSSSRVGFMKILL